MGIQARVKAPKDCAPALAQLGQSDGILSNMICRAHALFAFAQIVF
jgi:hypothetical protein